MIGENGPDLVRQLRDRISGLAQPTYVIDIPGGVSKAVASSADTCSTIRCAYCEAETRLRRA